MLTFSKEREPDLSEGNLNHVVGDVVELMQARAAEFDVELHWLPTPEMPTLVFDAEGIHRAVLNVVTNAIDAASESSEQPGRVDVRTGFNNARDNIRIAVKDNGPGIPADQLDDLFSPFVSSKKNRGTGLGLPVSQKILNEHGGRILVESKPGQGARFILELPAVPPENGQPAAVASDDGVTQTHEQA